MAQVREYYDSMKAAAAAMRIDVEVLKKAKGRGCPGFRGSRVYEKEVRSWIVKHAPEEEPITIREKKTHEEWRRLKLRNDKEEKKLLDAEKEAQWLFEIVWGAMAILRQKLINEFPAMVSGLDTPQCRIKGKELYDMTILKLRTLIRTPEHATQLAEAEKAISG